MRNLRPVFLIEQICSPQTNAEKYAKGRDHYEQVSREEHRHQRNAGRIRREQHDRQKGGLLLQWMGIPGLLRADDRLIGLL